MTEHDRGAYTPQPDAPLQFDARGPRMRRQMPMTLIGSAAVLVVLLGALALHYRHDSKPEQAAVPATAKVAQIKAPEAAAAAAMGTPAPVDVFGGAAHDPNAKPTLAAAPESPKQRAQLTVQATETPMVKSVPTTATAVTTPPVTTTTSAATKATTSTKATTATPVAATAKAPLYKAPGVTSIAAPPKPDATTIVEKVAAQPVALAAKPAGAAKPVVVAAASKLPPPKAETIAKATPAAATTKPAGGAVVQIGAFSSAALSDKGWGDVSSTMGGSMSGKTKRVEVVEKDGKTFYRTSVVGFSSRTAADTFCKALTAKGKSCFAKGV